MADLLIIRKEKEIKINVTIMYWRQERTQEGFMGFKPPPPAQMREFRSREITTPRPVGSLMIFYYSYRKAPSNGGKEGRGGRPVHVTAYNLIVFFSVFLDMCNFSGMDTSVYTTMEPTMSNNPNVFFHRSGIHPGMMYWLLFKTVVLY